MDKAQALFGAEAVVGLEQLILTDWQSSEHSSAGSMTPAAFRSHHIKHIGHNKGVEVCRLQWRAKKVSFLQCVDKNISDQFIPTGSAHYGLPFQIVA